jgi:hypothetical protein
MAKVMVTAVMTAVLRVVRDVVDQRWATTIISAVVEVRMILNRMRRGTPPQRPMNQRCVHVRWFLVVRWGVPVQHQLISRQHTNPTPTRPTLPFRQTSSTHSSLLSSNEDEDEDDDTLSSVTDHTHHDAMYNGLGHPTRVRAKGRSSARSNGNGGDDGIGYHRTDTQQSVLTSHSFRPEDTSSEEEEDDGDGHRGEWDQDNGHRYEEGEGESKGMAGEQASSKSKSMIPGDEKRGITQFIFV